MNTIHSPTSLVLSPAEPPGKVVKKHDSANLSYLKTVDFCWKYDIS
jgi:hypothetical protein